jgi:hypothetical protein
LARYPARGAAVPCLGSDYHWVAGLSGGPGRCDLAPGDADRQTQPIPILASQQATVADRASAPLAAGGAAGPPPATPAAPLAAATAPLAPAAPLAAGAPAAAGTAPPAPPVAATNPRRWWRGRRSAVLAAALVLILMAAPAAVLASHASHMPHPGPAGPHRPRTSQQISVSASPVRTVDLQGVPGKLTIIGGSGATVRLTGKLRWTGRPPRGHTTMDRAARLLRLSYQCAAASPCTENYRLVVPGRTAVILSQPSGQVLLDGLAGPLHLTAANVNVTATGLRAPSLTAIITSGQLTASFAAPPGQVSLVLTSAHATIRLPASVRYAVRTQVTSGSVQTGVPQAAHSGHLVTARLDSSDLQLQSS